MQLPLVYPTKELKSVKVGILDMSIMELAGSHLLRVNGDLPYSILSAICEGTTKEQFYDISLLDTNRIIFTAWKQTHMADKYMSKIQCECGKVAVAIHNIKTDYKKTDLYEKEHEIESVDYDDFSKSRKYKIILRPPTLKTQISLALQSLDSDFSKSTQDAIWSHIKSIDGKEDFNRSKIPLPLFRKASLLVVDDNKNLSDMIGVNTKCLCGKEHYSVLGWFDVEFLQG
jgi:hypothetical protein